MMQSNSVVHKAAANKLAALALSLNETMLTDSDELSSSAVIALLATAEAGELPIRAIADVVGLTHSAAVRLVDRLEKDLLVRRKRRVSREVLVEVTARGRSKARALADSRLACASNFISGLVEEDVELLSKVLSRIALRQKAVQPDGYRYCRGCDRTVCDCPIAGSVCNQDAGEAQPLAD